jgi:hypothetical protein
VRTSGNYNGNSYLNKYRASKSPMRGKGYYSLDMYRHNANNLERTKGETNERQSLFR